MNLITVLNTIGLPKTAAVLSTATLLPTLPEKFLAQLIYSILSIYSEIPASFSTTGILKTLKGTGGVKKSPWFGCLAGDRTISNVALTQLITLFKDEFASSTVTVADTTTEAPYWIGGTKRDKATILKYCADFKTEFAKFGVPVSTPTGATKLSTPKGLREIVDKYIKTLKLPVIGVKDTEAKANSLHALISSPHPIVDNDRTGSNLLPHQIGLFTYGFTGTEYISKSSSTNTFTFTISPNYILLHTGAIKKAIYSTFPSQPILRIFRPIVDVTVSSTGSCTHSFHWLEIEGIYSSYSRSRWVASGKPTRHPL